MTPFADFTYFGLLLYIVLPTVVLGLYGRANARWALLASALVVAFQFGHTLLLRPDFPIRELWIVLGYLLWQGGLALSLLRWKSRPAFYAAVSLALLPMLVAKLLPFFVPGSAFGFAGISYVTFRALDVIFSIHDGVIETLSPAQYFTFLCFFPTVSAGPIDRYRRFARDWSHQRPRAEFLRDLDTAVQRIFRGFFYKFILAALIKRYWMDHFAYGGGLQVVSYMYAYSLYLFFDFAGYSAFAIGFSYLLGIQTPENFDRPFLARNIRDFWQRWHISLSFWFRDHVYMRFLLAAARGKWFRGKFTANYLGLGLTFGLMGLWHGPELHYLIYGAYHALLLVGYDWFSRWNKRTRRWGSSRPWQLANIVITFQVVCFGLLIFSDRLAAPDHKPGAPAKPPIIASPEG